MTDAELDRLIISHARPIWLKVARILVQVRDATNERGASLDDATLQARLEHLISSGQIEAAGDITNWRFSEVRLPQHAGEGELARQA